MNDPRFTHQHLACAFRCKQLVRLGENSLWYLQGKPTSKGKYNKTGNADRAPALAIEVLTRRLSRRDGKNVNCHNKIDIHSRENNSCKCRLRTLTFEQKRSETQR